MVVQPIYAQIRDWLVGRIEAGELAEGSMLPPEQELAARFGVSRPTARQAVLELAREGVVARSRGRGTVVLGRRVEYPVRRLVSFSEEYAAKGQLATAKVLENVLIPAHEHVAALLGVEPGSTVFHLARIRFVNDEPVAIQKSYIAAADVPDIENLDFARGSLYSILRERYGFHIAYGDEKLSAGLPNRQESVLLSLPANAPVFRIQRQSYLSSGKPIEAVESAYRADRYVIRLRLAR